MANSIEESLKKFDASKGIESSLAKFDKPKSIEDSLAEFESAKGIESSLAKFEQTPKQRVAQKVQQTRRPIIPLAKAAFFDSVARTYKEAEEKHFGLLAERTTAGQTIPRQRGAISTITGKPIEWKHTEASARDTAKIRATEAAAAAIFAGGPQFEVAEGELLDELSQRLPDNDIALLGGVLGLDLAAALAAPITYALGKPISAAIGGAKRAGLKKATELAAKGGARGKVGAALSKQRQLFKPRVLPPEPEEVIRHIDPTEPRVPVEAETSADTGIIAKMRADSTNLTYPRGTLVAKVGGVQVFSPRGAIETKPMDFLRFLYQKGGKVAKAGKVTPSQTSELVVVKNELGFDWKQLNRLAEKITGKTSKRLNRNDAVMLLAELKRMPTATEKRSLIRFSKDAKKLSETQVRRLAKDRFGKQLDDLTDSEFLKFREEMQGVVAGRGKQTRIVRKGTPVVPGDVPKEPFRLTYEKKLTPPFAFKRAGMPNELNLELTQTKHNLKSINDVWDSGFAEINKQVVKELHKSKLPKHAYLQKMKQTAEALRFGIKGGLAPKPVWTAYENSAWRMTQWFRSRGTNKKVLIYPAEKAKAKYIQDYFDKVREPVRNMMRAKGIKPPPGDWIYDAPYVIEKSYTQAAKELGEAGATEELYNAFRFFAPKQANARFAQHRVTHGYPLETNIDKVMEIYVKALNKSIQVNKVLPQAKAWVEGALKGKKIDADTANYINDYIQYDLLGKVTESAKDWSGWVNKRLKVFGNKPVVIPYPDGSKTVANVQRFEVGTGFQDAFVAEVKRLTYWKAFALNVYQFAEQATQRWRTYSRMDLLGKGSLDALYGEMKAWQSVVSPALRKEARELGLLARFENSGEATALGTAERILDTVNMVTITTAEMMNRVGTGKALQKFLGRKGFGGEELNKMVKNIVLQDQFMWSGEKPLWATKGGPGAKMLYTFMSFPIRAMEWIIQDGENLAKGLPVTVKALQKAAGTAKLTTMLDQLNNTETYRLLKWGTLIYSGSHLYEQAFNISPWRAMIPRTSMIKPGIDIALALTDHKFDEAKERTKSLVKFWDGVMRKYKQVDRGWDNKTEAGYPVYDYNWNLIDYAPDEWTWLHHIVLGRKATALFRRGEAKKEIRDMTQEQVEKERRWSENLYFNGYDVYFNDLKKRGEIGFSSLDQAKGAHLRRLIPETTRQLMGGRKILKAEKVRIQEEKKVDKPITTVIPFAEE